MRVRNAHTASLGLPGGKDIAPGEVGDADDKHHVVKAWVNAGWLIAVEIDRNPVSAPGGEVAALLPKGRRGSK